MTALAWSLGIFAYLAFGLSLSALYVQYAEIHGEPVSIDRLERLGLFALLWPIPIVGLVLWGLGWLVKKVAE